MTDVVVIANAIHTVTIQKLNLCPATMAKAPDDSILGQHAPTTLGDLCIPHRPYTPLANIKVADSANYMSDRIETKVDLFSSLVVMKQQIYMLVYGHRS